MLMKGTSISVSGRIPSMASPHRVGSGKALHGQGAKASASKTSNAGGFSASRKKGSVRGSI